MNNMDRNGYIQTVKTGFPNGSEITGYMVGQCGFTAKNVGILH